jgi:hypothetical protein
MIDNNRDENFQNNNGMRTYIEQKEWRNLEELKVTIWLETETIWDKLPTTCNKTGKQQDAKNNAEI